MRGNIALIFAAALAAAALAAPVRAEEQRDPGAQINVQQSKEYERLLCSNPAFRKTRIEKECGPITDAAMRQHCVDSFNCDNKPVVHPRGAPPSETIR
jgi:hypothetical protein